MANTDTSRLRGQLAERAPSQAVERADQAPMTIVDLINRQRSEIARALPKHMDADRLARIAATVIKTTPRLMECTSTSLLGALMLSAQTGLEPGPLGHAYLVPRRIKGTWECQWMLGYKGIIELARRSGSLISIEAREVCERDHFEYAYGLNERLEHQPFMGGERGPIVAFWGLAKFTDGGHYFLVMSKSDVDKAMERSDAAKQGYGPWITDYAAMGRKTVIRRMAPFLPLAAEQAQVMAHDETTNTRIGPNLAEEPPEAGWVDAFVVAPEAVEATTSDPDHEPGADPAPEASAEPDAGDNAEAEASAEPGGFFPEADQEPVVDDGTPLTQPQSRALNTLLGKKIGLSGDDRFPWLSDVIGRALTSTSQITKAEASQLIDQLHELPDLEPDAT